jgi:hypothetical protein
MQSLRERARFQLILKKRSASFLLSAAALVVFLEPSAWCGLGMLCPLVKLSKERLGKRMKG